ncbi:MAG: diaminopimelate epimerase [Bacteroidia bacterium]|nr:diaminopimelate epimerase [Bacteroidia bacterium]NND26313.1 diaminopimelate epimerase [Flavobacteriaceae bacterium]NNK59581.1 diaminopimelate epimerase [Flavobacteriaceae bacterium]NNL33894.1 diaminopimelate epimerase [Flavobacteriaceae bacterium]RZW44486.1 MAG: diaminopimelate epimerase [Flavobacteriaceae bacterium]
MKHDFYKYQGTGNDFVIIDNRGQHFPKNDVHYIKKLCDRRFGIGADGLILLEEHDSCDFRMIYFNADGNESTMCGNGGRCITHFANFLGLIHDKATFEAIDGLHHAVKVDDLVHLQMQIVKEVKEDSEGLIIDTGSPHIVKIVDAVDELDVNALGAKVRYSEAFSELGINVNFVEKVKDNEFKVRTYERGVEAETLSCGTGVTAVALAMKYKHESKDQLIKLYTKGGTLQVKFKLDFDGFKDIWLIGPAVQVYKGELTW